MNVLPEKLLSKYIQIDTTSQTGDEMKGLLFMKSLAEELGLYTFLQETAPSKGNLVISASSYDLLPFQENYKDKKSEFSKTSPIILLSHVDVVPANSEDWEHHPFSGEVVDGEVWGRGAIDAKQIGITHLLALNNLKNQSKEKPLIQLITSEEETGSENGLIEFLNYYKDIFENALVFNEGGGFPIVLDSTNFYLIETGQKGNASFTVSIPAIKNANPYLPSNQTELELLEVLNMIQHLKIPNEQLPHSVMEMFNQIALKIGVNLDEANPESLLSKLPTHLQRMFSAMTKTTFTPTILNGGKRNELFKGSYELKVDARPLPNTNKSDFQSLIKEKISEVSPNALITWGDFHSGYDQKLDEDFLSLLSRKLCDSVPSSVLVPFMTIGSNDGRYVTPYGAKVVGYCPMTSSMTFDKVLPLVHGVNERIPIDDLHFGIAQLTTILDSLLCNSIEKG